MSEGEAMDPANQTIKALDTAAKVAGSPIVKILIDKATGFKLSKWEAEGEVKKREILDSWEVAKQNGVSGIQEASNLRNAANLINVASKSARYVKDGDPKTIAIDNDFFWNAVEHAKNVSDEDVQEVLAKIMAGEYNEPGKFSMSTLQSLKSLGKEELEIFREVASLMINNSQIPTSIYEEPRDFLGSAHFSSFQQMQALGLFLPNTMTKKITKPSSTLLIQYQDKPLFFQADGEPPESVRLPAWYGISQSGQQLIELLDVKSNAQYFKWLQHNYILSGYSIVKLISK